MERLFHGTINKKIMEQFFKVGDKVTCIVKGSGVVEEIVDNLTYPIIVRFCNSSFFKLQQ